MIRVNNIYPRLTSILLLPVSNAFRFDAVYGRYTDRLLAGMAPCAGWDVLALSGSGAVGRNASGEYQYPVGKTIIGALRGFGTVPAQPTALYQPA